MKGDEKPESDEEDNMVTITVESNQNNPSICVNSNNLNIQHIDTNDHNNNFQHPSSKKFSIPYVSFKAPKELDDSCLYLDEIFSQEEKLENVAIV